MKNVLKHNFYAAVISTLAFLFFIVCNITSFADSNPASNVSSVSRCRPPTDSAKAQFLIGYGSLIQQQSKHHTSLLTGNSLPVEVKGYKRGWYVRSVEVGFGTTYLGVIPETQSSFNGVVFELLNDGKAIQAYDQREAAYCRVEVPPSAIKALSSQHPLPSGQYWLYVLLNPPSKPSKRHPIVQSYVDIFLSGCLEIEQKFQLKTFAEYCLESSDQWSPHWINDRIYPRRPHVYQPAAREIDSLISSQLPDIFQSIKIENSAYQ